MGSLEIGNPPLKRAPLLRSSSSSRQPFFHRPRSRFARFLLFEKVDYLQWICTIAIGVFFFVVVLFQMFLPGSIMEKTEDLRVRDRVGVSDEEWVKFKEIGGLDFGDGIRFEPSKLLEKFQREAIMVNLSSRPVVRAGVRKPKIALVLADLSVEPMQLMMVSVAVSLMEIGYELQVYSLQDGPVHAMMYSAFDSGNYFVIPGSPNQAWEADSSMALEKSSDLRSRLGYGHDDFVIAIVGSEFSYSGSWLENAFILQALLPVISDFSMDSLSSSHLKVCILRGNSTNNYKLAVEAIALKLGYPTRTVEHVGIEGDLNRYLSISDLVIYGSFLEEQSFPEVLVQAMCFGKPIIAPDLLIIKKYVDDGINGFLFPKENIGVLTEVLFQAISDGKLSSLAQNVASIGMGPAKNLMASETIEGYASLLANVLKFPSEARPPKAVADIPPRMKEEWQWHLFDDLVDSKRVNKTLKTYTFIDAIEEQWNSTSRENSVSGKAIDEAFSYTNWEEERLIEMINTRKRREDEELKDRTDQSHGTWEEVYRNAKRVDRGRNSLHERDDRELERTGQPLCIYEPYFGQGAWPFLHRKALYRGIGLSTKGRRPGEDDIDAPSRLSILSSPYYRDVLGEYGAFFAIANRIDRIHKNAWIGFQSWRAAARKASLSKIAEAALLDAVQTKKHGDALYFWVPMDKDPRSPSQRDFWSFCDSINAGNCRFAVSEALRKMYGIKPDSNSLPPMPLDGNTWSVMHSWTMPTRSFLEFVMFSRMFVDALDAEMYDEHHQSGHCYLSLHKDRHCYSRVLELLVNVWAYHSARRMVYINPENGIMQEQHKLKSRKGQMWIRWFSFATLKSMDEDLAEEFDSDHPTRRWLWPSTGEVFWHGLYEREQKLRHKQKENRKQKSKDKLSRMRKRVRQKTIGKYVKPLPEDKGVSNFTSTNTTAILR
ncbi:hypothetical protein ACHQM5_011641 [Ranunculus cassubicifolius]